MPDIASVLKQEIARIAKKQLRTESEATQRSVSAHRKQLSELRRRIEALERQVTRSGKQRAASGARPEGQQEEGPALRFRAEGFKSHRERLGLSANDVGALIGASAMSVYKWEQGKARPRAKHLQAIAQLRRMGKRDAQRRLEELRAA